MQSSTRTSSPFAAVAAAMAAMLLALVGCSVKELDLAGKACPCVDGWVCDSAQNLCVPGPGSSGGSGGIGGTGGTGGTGGIAGSAGSGNVGNAAVSVTNLRVTWTTPNWIHWEWDLDGIPDQLLGFELVTGTSEADVESRSGSAVVWTDAENPELGRYFLPATGGEDPVQATMTDGHEPSTEYFGQLTAVDTASRRSVTNIAGGRTTDPPGDSIVIFADDATPGYSIPSSFVLSTREPYAGTHHYDYQQSCNDGEPTCFEILRRQGLNISLNSISQGQFSTTAYLEFALASGGPEPSYWSQMRIMTGTNGSSDTFGLWGWTIRSDGEYRVYQVPLRVLDGDGPMPYAALADGLWEFGVGGSWADGSYTMLDEIRLYW